MKWRLTGTTIDGKPERDDLAEDRSAADERGTDPN